MNDAILYHEQLKGKIEVKARVQNIDAKTLALAYTPGVAAPCLDIQKNAERAYELTRKWNTVAVVSDGSAVLGLGNIGALAGLPVMEGKAVLFNAFAGIDAIPLVLDTQDTEQIIATVQNLAITFGGINLEDIGAPRCFEVERRLIDKLDIPVFHDDQHGTAIVVLAALINALKLTNKDKAKIKVVINGAGAAGNSICKLLLSYGVCNIVMNDKEGILNRKNKTGEKYRDELCDLTNADCKSGTLKEAIAGADVFIGVSVKGALTKDMVKTMNRDAIVFAMANPEPEIFPDEAKAGGAKIVGTGRSDFPNQINNVLAFPGIFRGALDCKARKITQEMKLAASFAISSLVKNSQLCPDFILPKAFDKEVVNAVANAVQEEYRKSEKTVGK